MSLLAFTAGTIFGSLGSFALGCWLRRKQEPEAGHWADGQVKHDTEMYYLADYMAEHSESHGPGGVA